MKNETYAQQAQDIFHLSKRVYRRAPHLAEQEDKESFVRALPDELRLPVPAANPKMLSECVDNVTQRHAILGMDKWQSAAMKPYHVHKDGQETDKRYGSRDPRKLIDLSNIF